MLIEGMSIAFSSSLLGLAGSLILGLLDLNLGQAQNKFSQYFEKILNSIHRQIFPKLKINQLVSNSKNL